MSVGHDSIALTDTTAMAKAIATPAIVTDPRTIEASRAPKTRSKNVRRAASPLDGLRLTGGAVIDVLTVRSLEDGSPG